MVLFVSYTGQVSQVQSSRTLTFKYQTQSHFNKIMGLIVVMYKGNHHTLSWMILLKETWLKWVLVIFIIHLPDSACIFLSCNILFLFFSVKQNYERSSSKKKPKIRKRDSDAGPSTSEAFQQGLFIFPLVFNCI